jgi:hypothetical protein
MTSSIKFQHTTLSISGNGVNINLGLSRSFQLPNAVSQFRAAYAGTSIISDKLQRRMLLASALWHLIECLVLFSLVHPSLQTWMTAVACNLFHWHTL